MVDEHLLAMMLSHLPGPAVARCASVCSRSASAPPTCMPASDVGRRCAVQRSWPITNGLPGGRARSTVTKASFGHSCMPQPPRNCCLFPPGDLAELPLTAGVRRPSQLPEGFRGVRPRSSGHTRASPFFRQSLAFPPGFLDIILNLCRCITGKSRERQLYVDRWKVEQLLAPTWTQAFPINGRRTVALPVLPFKRFD